MKSAIKIILIFWTVASFAQDPGSPVAQAPIVTNIWFKEQLGFKNLVIGKVFTHQFELNNAAGKQVGFSFSNAIPISFSLSNTGLLTSAPTSQQQVSGQIQLNREYEITVTAVNLNDPKDKAVETFKVQFFEGELEVPGINTPSGFDVAEGKTVRFKITCLPHNSAISIYNSNPPANGLLKSNIFACGDDFEWTPDFSFVPEETPGAFRILKLKFIATNTLNESVEREVEIKVFNNVDCAQLTSDYTSLHATIAQYNREVEGTSWS